MNRLAIILLATAAISFPASARQALPTATQDATNGTAPRGRDQIGLTATQRQMIASSIAGFADMQRVPPGFQAKPGTRIPNALNVSRVPGIVQGVAPPAASYDYAMLNDKDLLLVKPRDHTIVDVIHLNRHL